MVASFTGSTPKIVFATYRNAVREPGAFYYMRTVISAGSAYGFVDCYASPCATVGFLPIRALKQSRKSEVEGYSYD